MEDSRYPKYLPDFGPVKLKVKLSLCLNKHHAMKTYWGSEGIAPRINLDARWKWMISFTLRPLYPGVKNILFPLDRTLDGPQSRSGRGGVYEH
jgi:hypothetical protein